MTIELEYSSSLNGASYLLFELKQVVKLQEQGFSQKEIRRKVIDENVFQFDNKGRITRTLPSVLRRAKVIDSKLASFMINGSLEMSKIINLYAIMKTDLLFYEFMHEIISEKLQSNDYLIEKKDINLFFERKSEQSEKVASWSATNTEKLKRAYMHVLFESGFLKERRSKELNHLIIDQQIKDHLMCIGDTQYVRAMGE